MTLAPKLKKYIATDQDYVIRLLKQNINENSPNVQAKSNKRNVRKKGSQQAKEQAPGRIETLELDWEIDSVSSLPSVLGQGPVHSPNGSNGVDLVIACDCIYNDALIEPLNNTCTQICRLRSTDQQEKPTLCLVAQQLRSPDVFEAWLRNFQQAFHVWRLPDELLTAPLQENSGFVVHIGVLR